MIRFLDAAAHLLHRLRLIPASVLDRACDAYDRSLGAYDEDPSRAAVSRRWAKDWDSPQDTAYDWVDDPDLDAASTVARFEAL